MQVKFLNIYKITKITIKAKFKINIIVADKQANKHSDPDRSNAEIQVF